MTLPDLLELWERDEERLRALGLHEAADLTACHRGEVASCWREYQLEELTLRESARYSGLAYGTIANKVRSGEIPNAGSKNRPRIRRCYLPMRPPGPPNNDGAIDLADRILHR